MKHFGGIIALVLLLSCKGSTIYQERKFIDGNTWDYDVPLSFAFQMDDTQGKYDMILDIDYSRNFGFQNLYTGINTVFPSGDTTFQRLSIDLTDSFGQWLGTCKGNDCSQNVVLRENTVFPEPGTYQLWISHYSRQEKLAGIKSFQLTINKSGD